jgi:hypothetical protein
VRAKPRLSGSALLLWAGGAIADIETCLAWHSPSVAYCCNADWTSDFSTWLDSVEEAGGPPLEWSIALLAELQDLAEPPTQETPTLKRVQQARRHPLWRLAHPYDRDTAVRIIVWFPEKDHAPLSR